MYFNTGNTDSYHVESGNASSDPEGNLKVHELALLQCLTTCCVVPWLEFTAKEIDHQRQIILYQTVLNKCSPSKSSQV